jgi:tape measure domain-containing protein
MKRAERQVTKSAGVMSRAVKGINTSLSGLGSIAGVTLGGAGLLAGAGAFLKIADAAKSLRSQLKLATSEFGSFEKANRDVRSIAEQTRSDLLATAELYAALQRNSGQLGTTQEQVARATQTVAQAFKISGAATSEQSAATRQLIQAFQSGVLRGDEFNSIMENAPRLAKLLADSMGVTTGALRKMAEEGELTADKLVRAFTDKKFTEGLDAEFRQLPVTFDEAMGQLYNSAVIVLSEFDRGGQFSTSLANFVTDGSEGFSELGKSAYQFGRDVSETFSAIETIREALASLQSDGILGFAGLENATFGWRDALATVLGMIDSVGNAIYNVATGPSRLLGSAFGKGSVGELFGMAPLADNPVNLRGSFLSKTNKQRLEASRQDIMGRTAADVLAEFGMGRKPPPFRAPPPKAKKGGGSKKAPRDRSEDVSFQFEQELRRAQMDVLRAQQSMAATHDERARIALQLLDAERQSKEAELSDRVRRAERDFAEKKITASALEQVKVQASKLRAEYDSVDALERKAIADDLAAEKAQDAAALIDSSYDLHLEQLQNESALAETTQERRAAELRILELAKQQEKARLEAVIADQQSSELAKQQAQQRLGELDNIYAGRAAVVRQSTRGPMESMQAEFGDLSEEMEQLKVQGIMGAVDALGQFTNGWDAMRDAAVSAIQQVLQELIRLQLMKMAMSFIGGGGPSGASIMSTYAGNTAAISGMLGPIPGMSTGGGFNIKGARGFDKNTLSLNGLPIANVSYGERVSVSNDNDGGMGGMGGIHIGAIHLPPGMTPSEGRKTALSFGRGLQESMGYTIMGRKR